MLKGITGGIFQGVRLLVIRWIKALVGFGFKHFLGGIYIHAPSATPLNNKPVTIPEYFIKHQYRINERGLPVKTVTKMVLIIQNSQL